MLNSPLCSKLMTQENPFNSFFAVNVSIYLFIELINFNFLRNFFVFTKFFIDWKLKYLFFIYLFFLNFKLIERRVLSHFLICSFYFLRLYENKSIAVHLVGKGMDVPRPEVFFESASRLKEFWRRCECEKSS